MEKRRSAKKRPIVQGERENEKGLDKGTSTIWTDDREGEGVKGMRVDRARFGGVVDTGKGGERKGKRRCCQR
jgi:hypothetical protein